MGWPCLTGDRQSSYYTENSVGASARLGGRRNVSKTSQRVHQTWTSTSVLGGRLARNLELSVAESPKGASATENRRTTEKEKTWCAQSQSNLQLHCSTYPHTHVPCVGKPSGLVLASLAIYGPTTSLRSKSWSSLTFEGQTTTRAQVTPLFKKDRMINIVKQTTNLK